MNKALIDTDILSEIGKAKDATVAANAKTYRRSFGHYLAAMTAMARSAPQVVYRVELCEMLIKEGVFPL